MNDVQVENVMPVSLAWRMNENDDINIYTVRLPCDPKMWKLSGNPCHRWTTDC